MRYGDDPSQLLELTRPDGTDRSPVVVLVHGGFWSSQYDLGLMRPLVPSLVAEGWAVAVIEYRRVEPGGIGWPATFEDASAAVEALAGVAGLDLDAVVAVGHSAGGHLATWLASRHRVPPGAPGASPGVRVRGAVSQAGVVDLRAAAAEGLGGAAAQALLGGEPDQVPDRYAVGSPIELVPVGVPIELVHGRSDRLVPITQSRAYAAAASQAGDPVRLTEVPGDHFAMIEPTTPAWAACLEATRRLLA